MQYYWVYHPDDRGPGNTGMGGGEREVVSEKLLVIEKKKEVEKSGLRLRLILMDILFEYNSLIAAFESSLLLP